MITVCQVYLKISLHHRRSCKDCECFFFYVGKNQRKSPYYYVNINLMSFRVALEDDVQIKLLQLCLISI